MRRLLLPGPGFVFKLAENEHPDPYIDVNRQLNAGPSIRYYYFDEVRGQPLPDPSEHLSARNLIDV